MPALFIYLIKVNAVLILFYLAYRLLLRPLTFYYLNRFFLLFALFFSTIYPLADLSSFFLENPEITGKLIVIVPDWQEKTPILVTAQQNGLHDFWIALEIIFWAGAGVLGCRLIIRLLSLYNLHKRSSPASWRTYNYRTINENINPFSFMRAIYLNERALDANEMEAVLSHEQVHTSELHTADVLLSELNTVFYWFNPGAWLMKNAVKENLEFITDRKVLQSGAESRSYQYSLLRIGSMKSTSPLVNHFNLITLKNRIIMMNKKKSSSIQATKYVVLVPIVICLAMVFTVSKAQLENSSNSVFSAIKKVSAGKFISSVQPAMKVSGKTDPGKGGTTDESLFAANIDEVAGSLQYSNISGADAVIKLPEIMTPSDTTYYNIDGKSVTGIQDISPENIASVQLMNKEQAAKIFGSEYPRGVMMIFTKANRNSEAVLELQKKIREVVPSSVYVTSVGKNVSAARVNSLSGEITTKGDTVFINNLAAGTNYEPVVVTGFPSHSQNVRVATGSGGRGGTLSPLRRVTGTLSSRPIAIENEIATTINRERNLNTLILLDGKEISEEELKSVPTKKIKNVNVVKGVVVISTKD